jgi:hypothetical protein
MDPMFSKEIKDKLKSMSNSAPGKVEYRHLKLVDPKLLHPWYPSSVVDLR